MVSELGSRSIWRIHPHSSIDILGIEDLLTHHPAINSAIKAGSITCMAGTALLLDQEQYGICRSPPNLGKLKMTGRLP